MGFKIEMFVVDYMLVIFVMGFCFDYKGKLLVILGDIKFVFWMVEKVESCDLFIYEVLNILMMWMVFGVLCNDLCFFEMIVEMMEYYMLIEKVVEIVCDVGVGKLVFNYMVLLILFME